MTQLRCCLAVLLLGSTACVSEVVAVAPRPPLHYEWLGAVEGRACGTLLLQAIPIQMDSRVTRAEAAALAKQPTATGLLNTQLSGDWIYWLLGITHCTQVNGDAIRETAAP